MGWAGGSGGGKMETTVFEQQQKMMKKYDRKGEIRKVRMEDFIRSQITSAEENQHSE